MSATARKTEVMTEDISHTSLPAGVANSNSAPAQSLSGPQAFLIAEMSDPQQSTKITMDVADLYEASLADEDFHPSTSAEDGAKFIIDVMDRDPIAGEMFFNDTEAFMQCGTLSASVHSMGLSRRDQQALHVHPNAEGDQMAGFRVVVVMPLWQEGVAEQDQGVTFSWSDIDITSVEPGEDGQIPTAYGEVKSPTYQAKFKPGQIGLVAFPEGAHAFHGNGVAVSIHFKNVIKPGGDDALLDNTAIVHEEALGDVVELQLSDDYAAKITTQDLRAVFNTIKGIAARDMTRVAGHNPHASSLISEEEFNDFVASFRAGFEPG